MLKPDSSKVLAQIFQNQLNFTFMLDGEVMSADEVFAANGLLALIGYQADLTCRASLNGRPLGIQLEANPDSLVGASIEFDGSKSKSLQMLYLFNAATELFGDDLTPNRTVELDGLLEKLHKEEPVCKVM